MELEPGMVESWREWLHRKRFPSKQSWCRWRPTTSYSTSSLRLLPQNTQFIQASDQNSEQSNEFWNDFSHCGRTKKIVSLSDLGPLWKRPDSDLKRSDSMWHVLFAHCHEKQRRQQQTDQIKINHSRTIKSQYFAVTVSSKFTCTCFCKCTS